MSDSIASKSRLVYIARYSLTGYKSQRETYDGVQRLVPL